MVARLSILSISLLVLASACTPSVSESAKVTIQSSEPGELIQPLEIDNCNGKSDIRRVEERSHSINAAISSEIAATFGVSVEAIEADVRGAVGAVLAEGLERRSAIELVAPPGTHMAIDIQWIGNEKIGIIENLRPSSAPIAFNAFEVTDVRIAQQQDLGCPTPMSGPGAPDPSEAQANTSSAAPTAPAENPQALPTLTACDIVARDFPQTLEEVRQRFGLPGGERDFRLIREGCGGTVTGFVFEGSVEFQLTVPDGGCIDSYSSANFTEPPVPESSGGLRAYAGMVGATGVTYRVTGCDLKP